MENSIKTTNEGTEKKKLHHRQKEEFEVCDIVNDKCQKRKKKNHEG